MRASDPSPANLAGPLPGDRSPAHCIASFSGRQAPANDFDSQVRGIMVRTCVGMSRQECAVSQLDGWTETATAVRIGRRPGADHDTVMLEIEFESRVRFATDQASYTEWFHIRSDSGSQRERVQQSAIVQPQKRGVHFSVVTAELFRLPVPAAIGGAKLQQTFVGVAFFLRDRCALNRREEFLVNSEQAQQFAFAFDSIRKQA